LAEECSVIKGRDSVRVKTPACQPRPFIATGFPVARQATACSGSEISGSFQFFLLFFNQSWLCVPFQDDSGAFYPDLTRLNIPLLLIAAIPTDTR
jgi:hypothetical protein